MSLSSRSFATLLVLVENAGQTLSKSQLLHTVWPDVIVEENNLSQAVSILRRALQDNSDSACCILTIPGRGYSFIAQVEASFEPDPAADDMPGAVAVSDTAKIAATVSATAAPGLVSAAIRPVWYRHIAFLPLVLILLLVTAALGYQLLNDPAPAAQSISATAQPALAAPAPQSIHNSVAVLPFTNLNPSPDNDLFAVGLHDEVINQLSKIHSLKVIARGSVLALSDQQLPMSVISRMLGVETVMNGTLLFAGNQARVNLQLLNPESGITLWTGTYEADREDLAEMFSIQSQIALQVSTALAAEITRTEQEAIARIPTRTFAAYRYNLAARDAYYKQDYPMAWQLAQKAIDLDSGYIDAIFIFASVNNVLVARPLPGMSSKMHSSLAQENAEKIIALAPERSEGYALKAIAVSSNRDWQNLASMLDTLESMEVPLSELKFVAMLQMCLGDFQSAIDIFQANLITEPMNIFSRGFLISALELNGNREQSRREYQIGEELSPLWWGDTVNIFLALGRGEPLKDIDQLVGISPELRHLLHNAGDTTLVRSGLQHFSRDQSKPPAEIIFYAALAAHTGEHELSVQFMRLALNDAWSSLHWFWLPLFNESRQLPAFHELLLDSGIVDYWQQRGWPDICQPTGESFTCDWQAYPLSASSLVL